MTDADARPSGEDLNTLELTDEQFTALKSEVGDMLHQRHIEENKRNTLAAIYAKMSEEWFGHE